MKITCAVYDNRASDEWKIVAHITRSVINHRHWRGVLYHAVQYPIQGDGSEHFPYRIYLGKPTLEVIRSIEAWEG